MIRILLLSVGLVISLSCVGLRAEILNEEMDKRWYISPMGTYVQPDSDRHAKEGYGAYLGIGKPLAKNFDLELRGVYDELSRSNNFGGGRYHQSGGSLNGLLFLNRSRFSPYGIVGLGALRTSAPGDSGTAFALEAGLGFMYKFNEHGTALRSDVRYRFDDNEDVVDNTDSFNDLVLNVGLAIPIGAKPAPPPPPPVVEADAEPVDSDSDGVIDENDRCAGTPAGVSVDEYGCELDSDGDGVVDSKDQCTGTISGAEVDENGCLIPQAIELEGVNFELNSAKLTPESDGPLSEAAATLKNNPNLVIEIAGHTDSTGTDEYNQGLSQRRAQSVVDDLAAKGVSNQMIARGYGESSPIASNDSKQGRSMNRRVELVILEK